MQQGPMPGTDEFADTPYAASFGPVPSTYWENDNQQGAKTEGVSDQSKTPVPLGAASGDVPGGQPSAVEIYGQPPSRRTLVPDINEVLMDDTLAQTLAAVERMPGIALEDSDAWQSAVNEVMTGLKLIQRKWQALEAERKVLIKPITTPAAVFMTRGARGRGRGRGRRRGRWRGA